MRKKRKNGECKENKILKVSILVSIIGSIIFLSVLKYTYPNLSYSEWYSILASFVAGALGGVITLITVYITLMGNESQEYNKMKKNRQLEVCDDIIGKINKSVASIHKSLEKNRAKKIVQFFQAKEITYSLDDDTSNNIEELINVYIANDLLLVNIYTKFRNFRANMYNHISCLKSIQEQYDMNKYDIESNLKIVDLYECCLENIVEYLEYFREEIYIEYYNDILEYELDKYQAVSESKELDKSYRKIEIGEDPNETLEEKYERIKQGMKELKMSICGISVMW